MSMNFWPRCAANTVVMRTRGLSVVCANWPGVGMLFTVLIGYLYLQKSATALKVRSAGRIVMGVCGLHAASCTTG